VRKLWGDGRGRFRTRGRYGAATVRGTKWVTQDRCNGTLVRVVRGRVRVEALAGGRRPTIVKAGQRRLVPATGA
jgi:ferric-dicitrate binding protein FerR (iron transport regulator)